MRALSVPGWCAVSFLSMLTSAPALADTQADMASMYAQYCKQAAGWPPPHGESDLNASPKLDQYCGCFGKQFADRAMKRAQQGGGAHSLAESHKEESAMRVSCRKQFGLPPPKSADESAK